MAADKALRAPQRFAAQVASHRLALGHSAFEQIHALMDRYSKDQRSFCPAYLHAIAEAYIAEFEKRFGAK